MTNNNNTKAIIGVDVSKYKLDIFVLATEESFELENTEKSIRLWIKRLKKEKFEGLVVMENTGGYERTLRRLFKEAGISIHVAHATRIYFFGKQKGYFAKTDEIDARLIALYADQEDLEETPAFDKDRETLKELTYRQNQIIEQITAEKCRIGREMSSVLKRSINRMIKHLEKEKDLIQAEIEKLIKKNEVHSEQAERLQTFKGVGKRIAYGLIGLVPELGHVNRASIACLIGVAPKNRDSGTKTGYRMIMGGRFYARKLLYMGALVAIRYNTGLKMMYERLLSKGKKKKVAIVAVMRKIIITLNAMLRDHKNWVDPHCEQTAA